MKRRTTIILFFAILTLGAFLRFYHLGARQLWLDEILQLQSFSQPTLQENLRRVADDLAQVPLSYLVQDLFIEAWGHSEWPARFHAALAGTLSLPLLFWLGSRLFSERVALLAMLVYAVYPLHQRYSQEGRSYALFVFLALAAQCLLLCALERGNLRRWAAYALCVTLALYTNYFGLLVLFYQGFFVLGLRRRGLRACDSRPATHDSNCGQDARTIFPGGRDVLNFGLAGGVALVGFAPWAWITFRTTHSNVSEDILPIVLHRFVREISGGSYALGILLVTLFCLGLWALWQTGQRGQVWLLLCWFLLPLAAALFLDWLRDYFFAIRQVLFATPALALGVAAGIDAFPRRLPQAAARAGFGLLVALVVIASLTVVYRRSGKEPADWKAVASYLKIHVRPNDRVAAPNTLNVLSYYFPEVEQRGIDIEALSERQSSGRVYLVASIYMTPEQHRKVSTLLESSGGVERIEFRGFKVHILKAD
ncbi:MAG: glycosyltransferase family 39 protein [Acidobacteriota bacterium]